MTNAIAANEIEMVNALRSAGLNASSGLDRYSVIWVRVEGKAFCLRDSGAKVLSLCAPKRTKLEIEKRTLEAVRGAFRGTGFHVIAGARI